MGKRMRFDALIAAERDDLIRACNFTGRERAVFERRAQGASVIETSMEMHVSEATCNAKMRRNKQGSGVITALLNKCLYLWQYMIQYNQQQRYGAIACQHLKTYLASSLDY